MAGALPLQKLRGQLTGELIDCIDVAKDVLVLRIRPPLAQHGILRVLLDDVHELLVVCLLSVQESLEGVEAALDAWLILEAPRCLGEFAKEGEMGWARG